MAAPSRALGDWLRAGRSARTRRRRSRPRCRRAVGRRRPHRRTGSVGGAWDRTPSPPTVAGGRSLAPPNPGSPSRWIRSRPRCRWRACHWIRPPPKRTTSGCRCHRRPRRRPGAAGLRAERPVDQVRDRRRRPVDRRVAGRRPVPGRPAATSRLRESRRQRRWSRWRRHRFGRW